VWIKVENVFNLNKLPKQNQKYQAQQLLKWTTFI